MKTFILLCLVALACSQGFLRNLQTETTATQDGETPMMNGTNSTNATNATNGTAANASNSSSMLGQIAAVDLSGNWTVMNTNCSAGLQCAPSYNIQDGGNGTAITIMITYPQGSACGANAGQTVNVTENAVAGVWFDTNANGTVTGLTGSIGILNPLNQSILLYIMDQNNAGAYCWEDLMMGAAANASGAANATNATNNTNVTWEGAWQASAVSLAYAGAQCCVPDVPVLIHVDNTTNSIAYALRAPNCAACGVFQNSVLFGNSTLHEGILVDQTTYAQYDVEVVFYQAANGNVRAVYPTCAIEFTAVAAPSC